MADISSLTQLISSFRSTTQQRSITPETVGSILQKIVDALGEGVTSTSNPGTGSGSGTGTGTGTGSGSGTLTGDEASRLAVVEQWKSALSSALPVLTSIAQGTANASQVNLKATKVSLATGATSTQSDIQIKAATTTTAGVMTAQQALALVNIQSQIQTINSRLDALGTGSGTGSSGGSADVSDLEIRLDTFENALSDVQDWVDKVDNLEALTGLSQGDKATDCVYLKTTRAKLSDGSAGTIHQTSVMAASRDYAGAMSAQHVKDIDTMKGQIQTINTRLDSLQTGGTTGGTGDGSACSGDEANVRIDSLEVVVENIETKANAHDQKIAQLENWQERVEDVTPVISGLSMGREDATFVYLRPTLANLMNGQESPGDDIQIAYATNKLAGVMRAEQVTALETATLDVSSIKSQITNINNRLNSLTTGGSGSGLGTGTGSGSEGEESAGIPVTDLDLDSWESRKIIDKKRYHITLAVVANKLVVRGHKQLRKEGYVPYLFRYTKKRNFYGNESEFKRKCDIKKGWNLYGSVHTVRLDKGVLEINDTTHQTIDKPANEGEELIYSSKPEKFMHIHLRERDSLHTVAWGKSLVVMEDIGKGRTNGKFSFRRLRFHFGLGFAKKMEPNQILITPANLVSNLAEFSIIYDPSLKRWHFGL